MHNLFVFCMCHVLLYMTELRIFTVNLFIGMIYLGI